MQISPMPQWSASAAAIWGSRMTRARSCKPIQIGLVAPEPIRLEGLMSIFEKQSRNSLARFNPIPGSLEELLSRPSLEYLVFDLNSTTGEVGTVGFIRRVRPDLRVIVLGPDGNDELVLNSIVAGARAYLDQNTELEMARTAIEVVASGSIFAPRRLLSKLIDRLLHRADTSPANGHTHLTSREQQVLDLLLLARSNREIASQLRIEERTVKAHVGRMMRKNGVENRIELSMNALNQSAASGAGRKMKQPRSRGGE
jgi:DNA-binding NarL/FixJ family response regulator